MMPRPLLQDGFGIGYRKIPVLSIGKEFYVDSSLIVEALEQEFPSADGFRSIYPPTANGRTYRPVIRGFASYWTDRPFFRVTTGLLPAAVWRTSFGTDRGRLIGHQLDPDKLEKKVPQNLSGLDMHLSLLDPLFDEATEDAPWIFGTATPGHADIALYYQLDWGVTMARGEGIYGLTGGGTGDFKGEGAQAVFNQSRYPGLWSWYERMKQYFDTLPLTESRIELDETSKVDDLLTRIKAIPLTTEPPMLHTPATPQRELDDRNGLCIGAKVSIAPDDTGRDHPTKGKLVALNAEEFAIIPEKPTAQKIRITISASTFRAWDLLPSA